MFFAILFILRLVAQTNIFKPIIRLDPVVIDSKNNADILNRILKMLVKLHKTPLTKHLLRFANHLEEQHKCFK